MWYHTKLCSVCMQRRFDVAHDAKMTDLQIIIVNCPYIYKDVLSKKRCQIKWQ